MTIVRWVSQVNPYAECQYAECRGATTTPSCVVVYVRHSSEVRHMCDMCATPDIWKNVSFFHLLELNVRRTT